MTDEQFNLILAELAEVKNRLAALEYTVTGTRAFVTSHESRLTVHDMRLDRLAAKMERVERHQEPQP